MTSVLSTPTAAVLKAWTDQKYTCCVLGTRLSLRITSPEMKDILYCLPVLVAAYNRLFCPWGFDRLALT